ncbi:hypothetical protein [Aquimarina litoralis]|uniref:hypothetical protein n=1 Tax=Aquimarina litoralis TaxID=584605 RepID=UPI001C55E1DC|nr:hypothetical protein [Aquimarina litoralis]MBW1298026.1 hypothetical protein [Aquimarina litoralis]
MLKISKLRSYALRAMYALIAFGLLLTIWPEIIIPDQRVADQDSVIQSMLGALALLALMGIRYPLKMLPVLIFELVWKLIWIIGYALPVYNNSGLDVYAKETFFACMIGIVLVPFAIPWRYVIEYYIKGKS